MAPTLISIIRFSSYYDYSLCYGKYSFESTYSTCKKRLVDRCSESQWLELKRKSLRECTLKILYWQGHKGPAWPKKLLYEEKRPCVSCDVSHEEMMECASAFLPKALFERAAD